jgi:hypothetical protein
MGVAGANWVRIDRLRRALDMLTRGSDNHVLVGSVKEPTSRESPVTSGR